MLQVAHITGRLEKFQALIIQNMRIKGDVYTNVIEAAIIIASVNPLIIS